MKLLYLVLSGYFVGSIPFGFLLMKYYRNIDIRKLGSSSTGSTNVLRIGNKRLALCTLLLDASKGYIFSIAMILFGAEQYAIYIASFACVLGHVYPVWLKFQGGKGVATVAGVFFAFSPLTAFVCVIVWGMVAKLVKISAIASLSFCFSFVVVSLSQTIFADGSLSLFGFSAFIFIFLLATHLENIKKLLNGKKQAAE